MEIISNRSQLLIPQYTVGNGLNSQVLVINNAQWSDVGIYKCIAAIDGKTIEAEASLDVLSELYDTIFNANACCSFVQFL